MKAVGIDLTNALAVSSFDATSSWFPSVILPLIAEEPMLAGKAAKIHRRGSGLAWPPECQIPYGNVPEYGKGRVTLAEAWRHLASFETQDLAWDNYQSYQTQISWQPDPTDKGSRISLSAQDIVYEAMTVCSPDLTGVEQVCLVVPDDLGEGAQQALLDRFGGSSSFHLLPRPVAIASDWCNQQNPDAFRIIDRRSGGCGFIWVLAMGMDRWEFCPLEIRKVSGPSGDVLIPVRDHTEHSSGLAVDGLSLLAAYGIGTGMSSLDRVWFDLTVGNLAEELINQSEVDCYSLPFSSARQSIRGWSGRLATTSGDRSLDLESLRSALIAHADKFKKHDAQCLGVVADGSLATLKVDEVSIAQRVLEDAYDDYEYFDISNGSGALRGAELVAQQLQQGLPSYRDRIAPILIYYLGRDEYMDPRIMTKNLIEARTVEAGKVVKTESPITEFFIKSGSDSLELVLGRKFGEIKTRSIIATLREKVDKQENVEITAEIRPGQGFASAQVCSVRPGFFETKLNWRTMKECLPPETPKYAWPPGVANVHSNIGRSDLSIFRNITELLSDYNPQVNLPWDIIEFRKLLAMWQLRNADSVPYQYDGKISSSNSFERFVNPDLLKELSQNLGDAIDLSPNNVDLIRLAGWMYEACPSSAITVAAKRIGRGEELPCDLEVAGKAFVEKEHVQIFVKMFIKKIEVALKDYDQDSNNNWVRAFRDMIRFRVNTLHPDFIMKDQIDVIEKYIIRLMYYESDVKGPKYNNCLYIAPHLLKRRRFDDNFLALNNVRCEEWVERFNDASKFGKNRQKAMAKAMLKVLKKEATLGDIRILASNEGR